MKWTLNISTAEIFQTKPVGQSRCCRTPGTHLSTTSPPGGLGINFGGTGLLPFESMTGKSPDGCAFSRTYKKGRSQEEQHQQNYRFVVGG